MEALDIRQHLQQESPDWFNNFFTSAMRNIAAMDLGAEAAALSDLHAVYSVGIEVPDPAELAYLQACWAAAKWLCECGARFVHDAHAIRWHSARAVGELDPMRPLNVRDEISIVFETDPTPGVGHLVHTRGLAKFGRPDVLLLGAQPEDAEVCASLLNGLALRAALGAPLESDQTVGPPQLTPRRLRVYEPEQLHPQAHLNNDGLVLDIKGWGLRESS